MTHWLVGWLHDEAMPLWLAHGIDEQAQAYHETLDLDDLTCRTSFRRLYIAARQIYVFAEAERAGIAGADRAVKLGLGFLNRHALQADGGYAWRFDLANRITDPARDLYDLAFVLFALSSANRPERCRQPALDLMAFIEQKLRDPTRGWQEADPPKLPRRQNPHMHLLEAVLAVYETFGEPLFLAAADTLVGLALDYFIQPEGGLAEYFDAQLRVVETGAGGYVTEPGHHYEWAWLLKWYKRHADPRRIELKRIDDAARTLIEFAERYGLSKNFNAAVDEVHGNGVIRAGSAKLWPQTERLKATLAWPEYSSHRVDVAIEGLAAYIQHAPKGCWHEQRDSVGSFIYQPMQAGSLYHLTCAISELNASGTTSG